MGNISGPGDDEPTKSPSPSGVPLNLRLFFMMTQAFEPDIPTDELHIIWFRAEGSRGVARNWRAWVFMTADQQGVFSARLVLFDQSLKLGDPGFKNLGRILAGGAGPSSLKGSGSSSTGSSWLERVSRQSDVLRGGG